MNDSLELQKIKQNSPEKFEIIFFHAKTYGLQVSLYKYECTIDKIINMANSALIFIDNNNLNKQFGSMLYYFNIYKRKTQWNASKRTISNGDTRRSITNMRKLLLIYNVYKIIRNIKIMQNTEQFEYFNTIPHPLNEIMSKSTIKTFEKSHTLESIYGYALAAIAYDIRRREKWEEYANMIKYLITIYEFENSKLNAYKIIKMSFNEMHNK